MPIEGIDPRVDVVFSSSAKNLIVRVPYNERFINSPSLACMRRRYLSDKRVWVFPANDYYDVMNLLRQYFADRRS